VQTIAMMSGGPSPPYGLWVSTDEKNGPTGISPEGRSWTSDTPGTPLATTTQTIREPEFAKRVELACDNNPLIPGVNRGRQVWVVRQLQERFGLTISKEGVRRWFAGVNKPEGDRMGQFAEILGVDVAWLAYGITPSGTPTEQRKRNAMASGAVNLVAGMIQMHGGAVSFPDEDDGIGPDIFAIIRGGRYDLNVALLAEDRPEEYRVFVPATRQPRLVIAVVPTDTPFCYDLFEMPEDALTKHGTAKGGYFEVPVRRSDRGYVTADYVWPRVTTFSERL